MTTWTDFNDKEYEISYDASFDSICGFSADVMAVHDANGKEVDPDGVDGLSDHIYEMDFEVIYREAMA